MVKRNSDSELPFFYRASIQAFAHGSFIRYERITSRTYTIYVHVCIQAYNFGIFIVTQFETFFHLLTLHLLYIFTSAPTFRSFRQSAQN